ncbi:PCNA-interacting partner isoform X2 [Bufo gargarizans]|uniref:PCNA-interacting partner isoform X2 n=1 Tax=Bufo gargarizans TaxID=30331 RepID=UPI001CF404AE|nr:PCNA-interacting partner isoform X2 [Bufo gargarizans]
MAALQENVLELIRCFRRQWSLVCDCERTTVCGADDMLLMLQLAVAEVNKKNGSGYTASLSDVLLTWKRLLKDKLGLISDGSPPPENYDSIRTTYDKLLKNSNSLDLIDLYAAFSKADSSTGTNIASDRLQEFLFGHPSEGADHSSVSVSTPCRNNMDFFKIKGVVKRIFCSYLSLLVNAKNDIALAQVINCPERGLDREAFTDLKHASKDKQMSLFLVATSFIRAVELGGKGYAPSESDPLRKHIKGLSQFVHFIDRLEEILGETHSTRNAAERILSAIKMHLIKGRGSGDSFSEAVMEVEQDLDLRIKNLLNVSSENECSMGISPARPRIRAINRGTAICGRETMKTLLMLLDEEAANFPSKNKAELLYSDEESTIFGAISLLALFRSPEQHSGSSPKPLNQRVQKCVDKNKPKLKQNLIKSQFSCTYKDDAATQIKPFAFPSMSQVPSCIHPGPKIVPVLCFDEDDVPTGDVLKVKTGLEVNSGNRDLTVGKSKSSKDPVRKSTKRKQFDDGENQQVLDNEHPQKRTLLSTKPKEKASTARKNSKSAAKKQIVGQAKLTSFFRL